MRIVRGRDSFNPVMYGRLSSCPLGTRVRVIMTLHPIVWLFLAIWSASILRTIVTAGDDHGGLAMLAAPWVIGIPIFYYDAVRSKSLLRDVLSLHSGDEHGG